ncbi:hypothetical protein C8Q80DRAFT_1266220 [Daedaleopsis nitida]|nr:hypothetical protein C8Q80DRAFT_1266220 [Daedaleopsis nitida]
MAAMVSNGSFAWLDFMTDLSPSTSNTSSMISPQSAFTSTGHGSTRSGNGSPGGSPNSQSPKMPADADSTSGSSSRDFSSTSPQNSSNGASSFKSGPSELPRRRIRPKIALDPDQPLTAQGKPRERVYVACHPWESESSMQHTPVHDSQPSSHLQVSYRKFPALAPEDDYDPFPLVDLDPPPITEFAYGADGHRNSSHDHYRDENSTIPPQPGLQFTRETWWDALLTFYATENSSTATGITTLTPDQRTATVHCIFADLRALFRASIYWVSFINMPRFFDTLLSPARRNSMQPALVLIALAVGQFGQSSEAEQGARGRAKASKLYDLAHGALQASLVSGWVDVGLIQAAWLIVYYEMQSHHMRSADRGRSSALLLDSLIRLFSLTTLDADLRKAAKGNSSGTPTTPFNAVFPGSSAAEKPLHTGPYAPGYFAATASTFGSSFLPAVTGQTSATPAEPIVPDNITLGSSTTPLQSSCNCATLSLGHASPSIKGIAPAWAGSLMWPENVSEGEFRKEECRRLVWSSVMMTAGLNSHMSIDEDLQLSRLWIKDPSHYALLFPGEALAMSGVKVSPNNVWTLYLRGMLLLHQCVCKRTDLTLNEFERARFTMQAWLEVDAIENALDQHTCELERNYGYQAREMLFSARMCMSHEFRRYIPQVSTKGRLFYRDKAESWLRLRMVTAERMWTNLKAGLEVPTLDYRKPVLIYWFMSHVIKYVPTFYSAKQVTQPHSRALMLWKADNTLTVALEAAKTFVKRGEYLMLFWPSTEQRREWTKVRFELVEACLKSGVPPPETNIPGPIPRAQNLPG